MKSLSLLVNFPATILLPRMTIRSQMISLIRLQKLMSTVMRTTSIPRLFLNSQIYHLTLQRMLSHLQLKRLQPTPLLLLRRNRLNHLLYLRLSLLTSEDVALQWENSLPALRVIDHGVIMRVNSPSRRLAIMYTATSHRLKSMPGLIRIVLQGPVPGLIKDRSPDRDRTPLGPDRDRSHRYSPAVPVRSSHRQPPVEDRLGLVRTGHGSP